MNDYLTGWRRYADFHGRSSIAECWIFLLVNLLINIILIGIMVFMLFLGFAGMYLFFLEYGEFHYHFTYSELAQFALFRWFIAILSLMGLFNLFAIMPTFAVVCRRLNDSRTSKLHLLWILVPFGLIVLAVLLFKQSRN